MHNQVPVLGTIGANLERIIDTYRHDQLPDKEEFVRTNGGVCRRRGFDLTKAGPPALFALRSNLKTMASF